MTPERWEHLKALFHAALELPPEQREFWVTQAAGNDGTLAKEALALLQAHESGPSVLDQPIAHPSEPSSQLVVTGGAPFPPGTQVGPFRIEQELGRGGMGIVYRAFDDRLGHVVALKVLSGTAAADPVRRKRFQNEALLAATINHPGVAAVHRLEQIDDSFFLATEFVAGHPLRTDVARGPLALQRALAIVADILRALAAAHAAGIVHRDLKPDNIMLGPHDTVKIVDFGIARSERFAMTRVTSGGPPGTPAYMAPEQLAGADADSRADIYAVGVMLAEMVSGQHPGMPAQVSLPWQLQTIVDRCLAREPAARFQSATDMLQALNALQDRGAAPESVALTWWRFHQVAAALVYWLMTIPAWLARGAIAGTAGRTFFVVILASVVVSSILRFHLCFTSFYYPRQLDQLRARVTPAITLSDMVFVFGLASAALALAFGDGHSALMVLLLAVAVGAGVAALVLEPATSRAAFDR